jgi:hypothetical protein
MQSGRKVALDYTVAVMRTPVEVTDELFARMKEHFTENQMVGVTAHLTPVNPDRFNAGFGIGSAGFSKGNLVRTRAPIGDSFPIASSCTKSFPTGHTPLSVPSTPGPRDTSSFR